jgi:hypothetical protein
MRLRSAKRIFEQQMKERGVNPDAVEPLLVWGAFRDFAHVSFNTPFGGLRFLAGVRASTRGDKFEIEIGRQFGSKSFTGPFRRPVHFYLVGVKLIYPPDESLLGFIEQRFSQTFQPAREFLREIEVLPIFKIAFHMMCPTRYETITF